MVSTTSVTFTLQLVNHVSFWLDILVAFPFIPDPIDDGVLHNLATEIGEDWKRLASQLNVKQMRIQAILRNNASKDQETAIYDMLVTWAKRIPKSMNKVRKMQQHTYSKMNQADEQTVIK